MKTILLTLALLSQVILAAASSPEQSSPGLTFEEAGSHATLNYDRYTLFNTQTGILGVVNFTYHTPVRVAENGVFQLWYADGSELVKEADAYVDIMVNCFVVTADFEGIELTSAKGYTLIIPEGTIIAAMDDTDDPAYNPRHEIPVTGSSGIGIATLEENCAPTTNYDLNGLQIQTPTSGQIYVRDGKKFVGNGK